MKVVDASVIVKILFDEEGSTESKKLLQSNEEIIVPDILFVEIANALATKTNFSAKDIEEGLSMIYKIGLKTEKINQNILIKSAKLAKVKGTAVYDMIYAVLAQEKNIDLVTADKKFKQKVDWTFIKLL